MASASTKLTQIIQQDESAILTDWLGLQKSSSTDRGLVDDGELTRQSREVLRAIAQVLGQSSSTDVTSQAWSPVRDVLTRISQARARQGFTPTETAMFIFSLKQAIFGRLRSASLSDQALAESMWQATTLLDSLGLAAMETFQRMREEVIARQQQEMMELSTPVVTLWKGILALPLIGTLDSQRTQVVMENLLQRIVETGSVIAILDITGVPTVDTLVAQHLLKTVAAARLMGADCIISGIRPQIAQTIVHLGVDLNSVTTKATLADAFAVALRRLSLTIVPAPGRAPEAAETRGNAQ